MGGSLRVSTRIPIPPAPAIPVSSAKGELIMPPTAACESRRFFFFLLRSLVSSRVVCCPCEIVIAPRSMHSQPASPLRPLLGVPVPLTSTRERLHAQFPLS